MFVDGDGNHCSPSPTPTEDPQPDNAQLLRRGGLIYEDLLGIDLHLVTDTAPHWPAVHAMQIAKTQEILVRLAALETTDTDTE